MKVLITGATGLIGRELIRALIKEDISIHFLSRNKNKLEQYSACKGFYWSPERKEISRDAFIGVSAIIHLAGATVANRWTTTYKKEILESRTKSSKLLHDTLQEIDHSVSHFISASGISIYPSSETTLYDEENEEVDDSFLARVVFEWEASVSPIKNLGIDVTFIRTGVVLAENGGILTKMLKTIKLGVGAPLGSGRQWLSWIHLQDIVAIYVFVLQNELEGIYNAAAPSPVTNKKLTKQIATAIGAPLWLPNVPGFILKLMLGEMSQLALEGHLVSSKKLEQQGYIFRYTSIDSALQNLL